MIHACALDDRVFHFSQWNVLVSPNTKRLSDLFRNIYRRVGKGGVFVPFFWCQEIQGLCQNSDNMFLKELLKRKDEIRDILEENSEKHSESSLHFSSPVLFLEFPETRRTPEEIRNLLTRLCALKTQVFLTTHSLFLLRELELFQKQGSLDVSWFSIGENGFLSSRSSDDIELHMLDSNLEQSTRYLQMEQEWDS